ncbi:MAG: futalosine hydrolase [Phycisphaerales bacterium]|nr:futalosine hydrolase [Phycisphaerales bacterium]
MGGTASQSQTQPQVRQEEDATGAEGVTLLVFATVMEAKASLSGWVDQRMVGEVERTAGTWFPVRSVRQSLDVLITGVGKANAAGAVGASLSRARSRYATVVNAGVGGLLPGEAGAGLKLCDAVVAGACIFADEGIAFSDGSFENLASRGFGPEKPTAAGVDASVWSGVTYNVSPRVLKMITVEGCKVRSVATVSTCSGNDTLALAVAQRTGAAVEAMEGAGVALSAWRLGVEMGEIRTLSNTTGDREKQVWEMRPALQRLNAVLGRIFAE